MLKADMHIHVGNDPEDGKTIKYSAEKLIDFMAENGFDVIAITPHLYNNLNKKLVTYANKKGILLILGTELELEGCHILAYNIKRAELKQIKKISDLRSIKRRDNLIIAPHPFYPKSLKKKLIKNIDVFDAIEYSHFYLSWLNPNKKARLIAKKYNKSLIGNSDSHALYQTGRTFSYIDSKKEILSVFDAIKQNKIKIETKPLPLLLFLRIFLLSIVTSINKNRFFKGLF